MAVKARVLEELGQHQLLKPAQIEAALQANEQAKYYFSLLQNACARAGNPAATEPSLRRERIAAGIRDAALDDVISGSVQLAEGRFRVPGAGTLLTRLRDAIERMITPLEAEEADGFRQRLASHAGLTAPDDCVTRALVDAISSADRKHGDTLHLLVMDVHKALNRLQVAIATERIDGANVYNLSELGAERVRAFMRGLKRTAPLKFDHPGLATTATEAHGRLIIQNDLGTTDAHVLVVTIDTLTTSITYTDIHLQRLAFFQKLFARHGVDWSASKRHVADPLETGGFTLSIGRYCAADEEAVRAFLDYVGSRLVFLIDWNRARKQLRPFVGKEGAIRLLTWAADSDVGHRGFLVIGGETAVYNAMEFAAPGRLHFGDRLDDVLGADNVQAYLRFVLETASKGLRAGRSAALITDEIKIDLRHRLDSGAQRLVALAFRHGCYVKEIAGALLFFMTRWPQAEGAAPEADRLGSRAAQWERECDRLLNTAREEAQRAEKATIILRGMERADDAADALEESAFLITLMYRHGGGIGGLVELARLLDENSRALVTALECATHLGEAGGREDLDDFLAAAQRIFDLEHATDTALRQSIDAMVSAAADFRALFLATKIAETLEVASDGLAHAAQLLRTYVLDEAR